MRNNGYKIKGHTTEYDLDLEWWGIRSLWKVKKGLQKLKIQPNLQGFFLISEKGLT